MEKVNGLSGSTKFDEFYIGNGVRQEWHEHPQTGELVIVDTWRVDDGAGCSEADFELVKVYPMVGCLLAKLNVGFRNAPIYE